MQSRTPAPCKKSCLQADPAKQLLLVTHCLKGHWLPAFCIISKDASIDPYLFKFKNLSNERTFARALDSPKVKWIS
jgi:hypothetical protein